MTPEHFVDSVRIHFEAARNPAKAGPMAKYMKYNFPFLGLPRPEYQSIYQPLLAQIRGQVDQAWIHQAVQGLWELPEREYQYAAIGLVWANRKALGPESLELAEAILQQKPWWDSVDTISSDWVGPLVFRFPQLRSQMDRWSRHPSFWVRRSAILHQLAYKTQTDTERLFDYCLHNAESSEFFIRKAIGWALREYAKTDSGLVYGFVAAHKDRLSSLSVREALKHQKKAKE